MSPFHGDLPSIAGTYSGECVIIGPAPGGFADAKRYCDARDIMAVNDIGMYLPRLAHWVTPHADMFQAYRKIRSLRYTDPSVICHCKQGGEDLPSIKWPISGHFGILGGPTAAIVAIGLGYRKVILAGLPASNTGHFYPDEIPAEFTERWDHGQQHVLDAWQRIADWAPGKIKSLSGNTRKIFGAP